MSKIKVIKRCSSEHLAAVIIDLLDCPESWRIMDMSVELELQIPADNDVERRKKAMLLQQTIYNHLQRRKDIQAPGKQKPIFIQPTITPMIDEETF
jgi:hypothetical protein